MSIYAKTILGLCIFAGLGASRLMFYYRPRPMVHIVFIERCYGELPPEIQELKKKLTHYYC